MSAVMPDQCQCRISATVHLRFVGWLKLIVVTGSLSSINCNLPQCCNANNVQDKQHVLFHCTHPHVVSLQMIHAFLFSPAGFKNVSADFLGQENNKLFSSFMH